MVEVDVAALKILSILGRKPKASLRSLSKEIGLSPTLLRRKIEKMLSDKVFYGISARINPFALGLEIVLTFVEVPPEKLLLFEKICDLHPYTHYRVRCFGPINGMFVAFQIPIGTTYLLTNLFEELLKRGLIEKWVLEKPTSFPIGCEADYSFYEPGVGWRFNWRSWAENINSLEPFEPKKERNVLGLLSRVDMQILRELSKNILRKRGEIAKAVGIELYQLNRRWRRLEDLGVIEGYRVLVGTHLLHVTSYVLFKCKSSTGEAMKLASAVRRLPYQSIFFFTPNGFILYIMMTSSDYPFLASVLRKYCEKMEVYWCDYHSSLRYYFYDGAFSNGSWRSDVDFMVNYILRGIKEEVGL